MKLIRNNKVALSIIALLYFVVPAISHAATLSLSPSSTSVNAGNIINVSVFVNSQGKVINNSDAIVQFPPDLLQVVSVDSSNSIFTLWVENPAFSNSLGQVTFNGGVPNPGYSGSNGKILSITFLAKKAGTATLIFGDSSIRENDGLGTNVISGKFPTTITINGAASIPVAAPVEISKPVAQINKALVVTSSTHPQQKSWYNNSTVVLSWNVPSDAVSVKTFLGSHSDSDTSVMYKPTISNKTIDKLEDGVWYFHVNYQTTSGSSPVTHYRLQIDTVNPKNFSLNLEKGSQGGATATLRADDSLSGVNHFTVSVDNDQSIIIPADAAGSATTYIPILTTGAHTIIAKAYDNAGNVSEASASITTDIPSSLTIDSYPASIEVNDHIDVSGTAPYPNASLSISLQKDADSVQTYNILSDGSAKFHFVSGAMEQKGTYTLWANLLREDGGVVLSSKKVSIEVSKPILLQIGSYTTELLTVLIPAAALLFALLFLLYFGWHKFFNLQKKRELELKQVEERIHHSLKVLSEEVTKQVAQVEETGANRSVSPGEKKAIVELKKAIKDIDLYIEEQIERIKKHSVKK